MNTVYKTAGMTGKTTVINKSLHFVNDFVSIVGMIRMNSILRLLTLLLLTAPSSLAVSRPWRLSIDGFSRPQPAEGGYRSVLETFQKQDPYSFFHALSLYMDEESNLNRFKIMQGWYEKTGSEPYRLTALAFLYNAWDPRSKTSNRLMLEFLWEHHHEPLVLSLYFYRCLPLAERGEISFTAITEDLLGMMDNPHPATLRDRRGLHRKSTMPATVAFVELEGLHFLDTMLHAEINPGTQQRVTALLLQLWQRHKRLRSPLYLQNTHWFEAVIGFYLQTQRQNPEFLAQSMKSRRQLFCDQGFCDEQVQARLEQLLTIPGDLPLVPEFLQYKNQQIPTKEAKL